MARMPHDSFSDVDQLEAIYRDYFADLTQVAVTRFHVPLHDAEHLVHDVLLAALRDLGRRNDPHSWLIGAVGYAARVYREGRA